LCDAVNDNFVAHGKDCVKALKIKLEQRKDATTTGRALYALEMCMKNCGPRYHAMMCAKEVPKVLVKLCERAPSLEVRDKVLQLVEEWAVNLSRRERAFQWAYDTLRGMGFRFPNPSRPTLRGEVQAVADATATVAAFNGRGDWTSARVDISEEDRRAIEAALAESDDDDYGDTRDVIGSPVASRPPYGVYPGGIATGIPMNPPHLANSRYNASGGDDDFQRAIRESQATARAPAQTRPAQVSYTAEDVRKLKGDVAAARNSFKVFAEVLDGVDVTQHPSTSGLVDGVASELAEQCRAMKPRLEELISNTEDEELLMSALALHEDLVQGVERFELLLRAATGDSSASARVNAKASVQRASPTSSASKATTASLLDELDEVIKAGTPQRGFTASATSASANPFDAAPGPSNPFAARHGAPVASMSPTPGPSAMSMSRSYDVPSTSSPPTTTTMMMMHMNPMFDARSARPLPEGMRPMNASPSSPAPSPPSRATPRSPTSDPFADLSAVAASRAAARREFNGELPTI
jgi:hypothetical protein